MQACKRQTWERVSSDSRDEYTRIYPNWYPVTSSYSQQFPSMDPIGTIFQKDRQFYLSVEIEEYFRSFEFVKRTIISIYRGFVSFNNSANVFLILVRH